MYEVRALTNRWLEPLGSQVISSHGSAEAALAALDDQPPIAGDGTRRTTHGEYVAKVAVRVNADGTESSVLPPPHGEGLRPWPYSR